MRNKLAVFLVLGTIVSFVPAETAHAVAAPLKSSLCPNPTAAEINPSGPQTITIPIATSPDEVNKILWRYVACPSACYNVNASLSVVFEGFFGKKELIVKVNPANQCAPENRDNPAAEGKGCPPSQKNEPRITVNVEPNEDLDLPGQIIGPKSRCDDELPKLIDSSYRKINAWDKDGLVEELEKLSALPAPPPATPIDSREGDTLSAALAGYGLDETSIHKVRSSGNTDAALQAIANKDPAALEQVLQDSDVALNNDLRNNIGKLSDLDSRLTVTSVGDAASTGFPAPIGSPTFTSGEMTMEEAACRIARNESGSCEGNYTAIGPPTRKGGRAYGKYQVMDFNIPSWTAETPEVGRLTVEQFYNCPACQEKVFEYKFSQLAARCGGPAGAASAWHSGNCDPGNSTDGYSTTVEYVRRFLNPVEQAVPFGGATRAYLGPTSPFANLNPFYYTTTGVSNGGTPVSYYMSDGRLVPIPANQQPIAQTSSPGGLLGTIIGLFKKGSDSESDSGQSQGGGQGSRTAPPANTPQQTVQPNAAVIVQPKQVERGDPFVVSWSSVGISPLDPCRLYLEIGGTNELLMHLNEGSRTIIPSATSTPGVWEFTLQCPTPSGEVLERTASTSVQ